MLTSFLVVFLASGVLAGEARRSGQAPADQVAEALQGSWKAEGADLAVNIARVTKQTDRVMLYVEIAPISELWTPERQEVIELFEYDGELRLRVNEFRRPDQDTTTLIGLWTVPSQLPAFSDDVLFPRTDLILTSQDGGWEGQSTCAFPVQGGGIESSISMGLHGDSLHTTQTVGQNPPVEFHWKRYDSSVTGTVLEGGVVAIDYVKPAGTPASEGDELLVHYTGYNESGEVFDSSRKAGREPFNLKLPGRVIRGWQVGLENTTQGTIRRLVIPPQMGYGNRSPTPLIPPNETLCFNVEIVDLTDN